MFTCSLILVIIFLYPLFYSRLLLHNYLYNMFYITKFEVSAKAMSHFE